MMICMTPFHSCVCKLILDRLATITSIIHAFRGIEFRIALLIPIPLYDIKMTVEHFSINVVYKRKASKETEINPSFILSDYKGPK